MKKTALPLKIVAALAMLSAISIVAGKYLAIPGGEVMRFSFENLPIILSSVAFGPVAGALVGVVADLVGCLLVGYTINPIITIGAAATGAVSGIVWWLLGKLRLPLAARVAISVFSGHLVGSVLIKTVGLAAFYALPFHVLLLWRLLNYLIVGALEAVLIYLLMRNRMICAQIASLKSGRKKQNRDSQEK